MIDDTLCEALAARAAQGEEAAWRAILGHLWPELRDLVRRSRTMGRLSRSDDHVNDVLTRLAGRLAPSGGDGLRLYGAWRERNPDKTFTDWIRIVTVNVMRRHVREQLASARGEDGEALPSVKRLLNEFAQSVVLDELGVRPPITDAQTAAELVGFARARLPAVQCRALLMWLEGASFGEIADALELVDAKAGERTVRAATAVLRRHFVGPGGPS